MKFEASFFFKQNYCHTSFAVFFAFPRKFTIIIDYRWLTSFPGFSPTSLPRRRSFGNSPTRSACFAPTRSVGTNWRDDWERGWWDNYHLLGAISTVFFFGCIAFFRDQNVRQKKKNPSRWKIFLVKTMIFLIWHPDVCNLFYSTFSCKQFQIVNQPDKTGWKT